MKKLLMGALLVLMMFALVGCGEKAGGTSTSGNNSTNSGSSNTNKFKGTTWVYEEYGEYGNWRFTIKFTTESTGKLISEEYDDYESYKDTADFDYTVESSDTCYIYCEDFDLEGEAIISGSTLKVSGFFGSYQILYLNKQ